METSPTSSANIQMPGGQVRSLQASPSRYSPYVYMHPAQLIRSLIIAQDGTGYGTMNPPLRSTRSNGRL
jgi:hypothetical protein